MPDIFDYDVFLSFSSRDEEVVKPVWQELSHSGLRVFWSDETLKQNAGQSFFEVIQEALVNSRHLLLLMSANAANSEWVKLEYGTFFNECFLPAKGERRLIVYPVGGYDTARLPPFLKNLQISRSVKAIIPLLGGVDIGALKRENAELREKVEAANAELQRLRDGAGSELVKLRQTAGDESQKLKDEAEGLRRLNAEVNQKLSEAYQVILDLRAAAAKAPPQEKVENRPSRNPNPPPVSRRTRSDKVSERPEKNPAGSVGTQPPVVALLPLRDRRPEVKIGTVSNYFTKAGAAVVSLDGELRRGDRIRVKGHTTNFEQMVTSMRAGDEYVLSAETGEVTVQTTSRCRKGDEVYKVK